MPIALSEASWAFFSGVHVPLLGFPRLLADHAIELVDYEKKTPIFGPGRVPHLGAYCRPIYARQSNLEHLSFSHLVTIRCRYNVSGVLLSELFGVMFQSYLA
jgi:hypothetical protein